MELSQKILNSNSNCGIKEWFSFRCEDSIVVMLNHKPQKVWIFVKYISKYLWTDRVSGIASEWLGWAKAEGHVEQDWQVLTIVWSSVMGHGEFINYNCTIEIVYYYTIEIFHLKCLKVKMYHFLDQLPLTLKFVFHSNNIFWNVP